MSQQKIWDRAPEGLYLAYADFGTAQGQICDPTPDLDTAVDALAEAGEDGQAVIVLLVRKTEEALNVSDATQAVQDALNARLRARDMDEMEIIKHEIPAAFLTHIALWGDGGFGSLAEFAGPNDESGVRDRVATWLSTYGSVPGNDEIAGTVILLEKGEAGWTARELFECPTAEKAPAPHGTA